MTENPFTFQLPKGVIDKEGNLHREGELKPLSGKEEETLCLTKGDGVRVITSLLTCCVQRLGTIQPFTIETAQNLSPADRCFLLLKLWETTFGSRIRATVTCPGPGCGEKIDIGFSTRDIPIDESADPLSILEPEAHCCDCGLDFSIPFDLYKSFFGKLRTGLDLLYREVHCLAYHYHWSEKEIMELPRAKRRKYLEILADEIERMNHAGGPGPIPYTGDFHDGTPWNLPVPFEGEDLNDTYMEHHTGNRSTTNRDTELLSNGYLSISPDITEIQLPGNISETPPGTLRTLNDPDDGPTTPIPGISPIEQAANRPGPQQKKRHHSTHHSTHRHDSFAGKDPAGDKPGGGVDSVDVNTNSNSDVDTGGDIDRETNTGSDLHSHQYPNPNPYPNPNSQPGPHLNRASGVKPGITDIQSTGKISATPPETFRTMNDPDDDPDDDPTTPIPCISPIEQAANIPVTKMEKDRSRGKTREGTQSRQQDSPAGNIPGGDKPVDIMDSAGSAGGNIDAGSDTITNTNSNSDVAAGRDIDIEAITGPDLHFHPNPDLTVTKTSGITPGITDIRLPGHIASPPPGTLHVLNDTADGTLSPVPGISPDGPAADRPETGIRIEKGHTREKTREGTQSHRQDNVYEETEGTERIQRIRRGTSLLNESDRNPVSTEKPVPSQPGPPPVQPKVIHKPAPPVSGTANGASVPCAFWERKSLIRFGLNILR